MVPGIASTPPELLGGTGGPQHRQQKGGGGELSLLIDNLITDKPEISNSSQIYILKEKKIININNLSMKLVLHNLRQVRVPTITKPLIVHLFGIAGISIIEAVMLYHKASN